MKNKLRKILSLPGLLNTVKSCFKKIADKNSPKARGPKSNTTLQDYLMCGLAIFNLKFPSLLQYDIQRHFFRIRHNLASLYQVSQPPCDTYLRERLDEVNPTELRPAFNRVLNELQRGKVLEQMEYWDGAYLLSADGTGYYSSNKVHCENCCEKHHRNGKITYYHQLLGAAIVHPDQKAVIPLAPEPIQKQDGSKKNDCERNAAKRLFESIRREHPHLKFIVIEDALSSNGPHLKMLDDLSYDYIIGVKPGDHAFLFDWVKHAKCDTYRQIDQSGTIHEYRYINQVPLNDANFDYKVNFLEYTETSAKGEVQRFSWVTKFTLTKETVYKVMRGGRARWKIENETFNTLKNQGYQFEHNFGHGNKNLCVVFSMLMMLAFLIDQVQALCCGFFKKMKANLKSNRALWEWIRAYFKCFEWGSWEEMYEKIIIDTTKGLNTS